MISILFSWIIITFTLYTTGRVFINLYNRITVQTETYGFIDQTIVGMTAIIIPLSIWSLFLPSNHIFLFIIFSLCCCYYLVEVFKKKSFPPLKRFLYNFTSKEIIIYLIISVVFITYCLWQPDVYDSLHYHYQNIRWNEEFAIVPGLANIEDRFGFNSNILLLQSIYTLRFLFNKDIYTLNQLFVLLIFIWLIRQWIRSRYRMMETLFLSGFVISSLLSIIFINNTSTDILPNTIIYYLISRFCIFGFDWKNSKLLLFTTPFLLITFKLSFAIFGIVSLCIFIYLIKEKKIKSTLFLSVTSAIILICWLIRNIIISGYLVYPLYQIDLFDVDWKLPIDAAQSQLEYIEIVGKQFFKVQAIELMQTYRDPQLVDFGIFILYSSLYITTPIAIYKYIKKRKEIPASFIVVIACLVATVISWFFSGPDFRFVPYIMGIILITNLTIIFKTQNLYLNNKLAYIIPSTFLIIITIYTITYYSNLKNNLIEKELYKSSSINNILCTPYTIIDFYKDSYTTDQAKPKYRLNENVVFYIREDSYDYDKFPLVPDLHYGNFTSYYLFEARGNTYQDGFKAKENK